MILQTPKGFKDYLPGEARRRKYVLNKIIGVFEKFGFDPLETPTLEYEETLTGKYGEEEKLIYKFETPGGDKVALKYDLTVPLARVVAEYGPNGKQLLAIPFKRYQIQSAYRGENTQKGRYREFTQCDVDTVGSSSPISDAEILAIIYEIYQSLNLDIVIKVNDRTLISDIEPKYLASLDKFLKIGQDGVIDELIKKGLTELRAKELFDKVSSLQPSSNLQEIIDLYTRMGYPKDSVQFDPMLIRGLDYYTGLIVEGVLKSDPRSSSLCGGGRYDKLIAKFIGQDLPATGFSIGLDRTIEAMEELQVLDLKATATKVLVTVFVKDLMDKSLELTSILRSKNIPTEIWLNPETDFSKQLKYADTKGIPFVIVIGPDEVKSEKFTLKKMTEKSQETITLDELTQKLSS